MQVGAVYFLPQDLLMFTIHVAPSAVPLSRLPSLQSKVPFHSKQATVSYERHTLKVHCASSTNLIYF